MRAARQLPAIFLLFTVVAAAQGKPAGSPDSKVPERKSGAASSTAKPRKPAATALRSECLDSVGLCISVPAAWQRLGNIFSDLGFVAAEPHPGVDSGSWPHLTVVAIDVSGENGDRTPSLDALVERMLSGNGALAAAHLLERSSLLLNGANAQIVRVGLPAEAGGAEAIETVALIEGEEGMVYSIALHCSPPDVSRLEPVFRSAAESWRIKGAEQTSAAQPKSTKRDPASPTQINP